MKMKIINGKYKLITRDLSYNDWMLYIHNELVMKGYDIKKEDLML
jgi:hypothetical protein